MEEEKLFIENFPFLSNFHTLIFFSSIQKGVEVKIINREGNCK